MDIFFLLPDDSRFDEYYSIWFRSKRSTNFKIDIPLSPRYHQFVNLPQHCLFVTCHVISVVRFLSFVSFSIYARDRNKNVYIRDAFTIFIYISTATEKKKKNITLKNETFGCVWRDKVILFQWIRKQCLHILASHIRSYIRDNITNLLS